MASACCEAFAGGWADSALVRWLFSAGIWLENILYLWQEGNFPL